MQKAPLNDNQLKALALLLDDDNQISRDLLIGQFKIVARHEPERVERLIKNLPLLAARRAHRALEEARWDQLEQDFQMLSCLPDNLQNLEFGMFLLASFEYPRLRPSDIAKPLERLATDLQRLITGTERPVEIINCLNYFLFSVEGFRGNEEFYYDPDNSYFNKVLERKLGIPITLSCLYLLLGQRLKLPFTGIALPGHFIVEFQYPEGGVYLDPFRGGKILTLADCKKILSSQNVAYDKKHFLPAPMPTILARMMTNLVAIYLDRQDERRAKRLMSYYQLFDQ